MMSSFESKLNSKPIKKKKNHLCKSSCQTLELFTTRYQRNEKLEKIQKRNMDERLPDLNTKEQENKQTNN